MLISDGNIEIRCPKCGANRKEYGFRLQIHYMWKNQNGCCIRIFCHVCGQVTNAKELYADPHNNVKYEFVYTITPDSDIPF